MTLSKWERGEQRVPGYALPVLLKLYRVTLDEINELTENGDRGTSPGFAEEMKSVHGVGESSAVRERSRGTYNELAFSSPTSAQKGRTWLEQFLTEIAEEGATQEFIDSSRRLLLNPANYEHGFGAAAGHPDEMDDDQKLRHMQALAVGIRAALKDRLKKGGKR